MSLAAEDYTYLGDSLHVGIDFSQWYASGDPNPAAGTLFDIASGAHAGLGGYIFSTLPLSFDTVAGWQVDVGGTYETFNASTHGFSGEVVAFSELGSCVPEPMTVSLFGIGFGVLAVRRMRKKR